MSVLHVITGLGVGGAELSLLRIASGLKRHGLQQAIVSLGRGDELRQALEEYDVPVTELNISGLWSVPSAIRRLAHIIEATQPRVIQGWMYHGDIAAALAHRWASNKDGRRLYWGLRASNVDAERYGWIVRVERWLSAWPDAIVSNSVRGIEAHLNLGYQPRRYEIIPNGVDASRFRPDADVRRQVRAELGIPGDADVAILVARLDRMKDHQTFLKAMEANPSVLGLLVGKGTDGLKLPVNVRALGMRREVERLYAASDVVVLSSAFGEGFPNVVAEGMSAGLVPIVTDVGDAAAIVGETGRIVRPGDASALALAIAAEMQTPRDERAARAAAARRRILDHYSIDSAVSAFERLYAAA